MARLGPLLKHGLGIATLLAWSFVGPAGIAQINAYSPYADSERHLPPVAPDGTLRWGTFYKSATIQKAYERLWELGACRNTNKAITIPVEMNKVAIDALPEEEFRGTVVDLAGTIHGGLVAFRSSADGPSAAPVFVAALHPAGVSKVVVNGPLPISALRPGMTVRLDTRVDRRGVASEPVTALDVVTPESGFKPIEITPEQDVTVTATLTRRHGNMLSLHVGAGAIRRLSVPIAPNATVVVDATELDLISPGDAVTVKGRAWRGEGCLEDGTVFASTVSVAKHEHPATAGQRESRERTAKQ